MPHGHRTTHTLMRWYEHHIRMYSVAFIQAPKESRYGTNSFINYYGMLTITVRIMVRIISELFSSIMSKPAHNDPYERRTNEHADD